MAQCIQLYLLQFFLLACPFLEQATTATGTAADAFVVGVARTQLSSIKEYSLGESHVGTEATKDSVSMQGWKAATAELFSAGDPAVPFGKLCKETHQKIAHAQSQDDLSNQFSYQARVAWLNACSSAHCNSSGCYRTLHSSDIKDALGEALMQYIV